MILLALLLLATADYPHPPSLDGAREMGCTLRQMTEPDRVTSRWHVRVWVEFPNHRWTALYAIREGNERRKAMRDCDEWLRLMKGSK